MVYMHHKCFEGHLVLKEQDFVVFDVVVVVLALDFDMEDQTLGLKA